MHLELTRYGSIPSQGTFGELRVEGMRFQSVEREWQGNEPYISAIPAGTYKLEPHSSRQHGETWALVNEDLGVYHWKVPGAKRYAILIHVANRAKELSGCIGIGRYLGTVKGEWAVTSSKHAMEHVMAILARNSEHTLTIKWADVE